MSALYHMPILQGAAPQREERARRAPRGAPHAGAGGARRLIDSHGRTIRDLRLSITDRCNFRCVYCMDPGARFLPVGQRLTVEELIRVTGACVALGVTSVRLTGGEPTLHPDLEAIIAGVAALGVRDLSMTTNGSVLDAARLTAWRHAGLHRLTFSLDALSPVAFARMARARTPPGAVLAGIDAARRAGLGPLKVNAVVVRGYNEGEVPALARLAGEMDLEVRFIEFMPLDAGRAWSPALLVPADEIVQRAGEAGPLVRVGKAQASSTSETYVFADGRPGKVGVIAPVTRPFCGQCSRLRITADGQVRPCLFSVQEFDLRARLRAGESDEGLQDFLIDSVWRKQAGHGITAPGFVQPPRTMSAIGG